jgi:AraC-like DNA-binding protein
MLLHSPARHFDSRTDWLDRICQFFVPLEIDDCPTTPFRSLAARETMGCLEIVELVTSAQRVRRTRSLAARSDQEKYKFSIQLEGRSQITQDGRSALLHPGQWSFYDTSRPYEVRVDEGAHFLVLHVGAPDLQPWLPELRRKVAIAFHSDQGCARVAMDSLRSLVGQTRHLPAAMADEVSATVLRLMGLGLLGTESGFSELQDTADRTGEVRRGQLQAILHHIHRHLHDPDLGPEALARQFRISRRYLYKLFELQGLSPADYIQATRLARCRDMLAGPGMQHSITELAYTHGFSDPSTFGRAFRRQYGMSPGEWRRQHAPPPPAQAT